MTSWVIVLHLLAALSVWLVWRLCRRPVRGDAQSQMLWRGAVAGFAGEMIGVSLSSVLWRPGAYWYLGYLFWLAVSAVLGIVFTLLVWGAQKVTSSLNLPARAAAGAILGAGAAWLWAGRVAANRVYSDGPADDFGNSIVAVIMITGVVSGMLAGPTADGTKES